MIDNYKDLPWHETLPVYKYGEGERITIEDLYQCFEQRRKEELKATKDTTNG